MKKKNPANSGGGIAHSETPPEKAEDTSPPSPVTDFTAALPALKLKPTEVLSHKEYDGRIVVVTIHGQKLTCEKGE